MYHLALSNKQCKTCHYIIKAAGYFLADKLQPIGLMSSCEYRSNICREGILTDICNRLHMPMHLILKNITKH